MIHAREPESRRPSSVDGVIVQCYGRASRFLSFKRIDSFSYRDSRDPLRSARSRVATPTAVGARHDLGVD